MIVFDPLYGRFKVPPYLEQLASTPEVRRLSQVRLLNAASPTLAVLGELRRYSHTLGVLHLCESNPLIGYSLADRRALAASVLVHDIGTPPFGHLFEYHLREKSLWSHENIIRSVIWGTAARENRAHQIFAGRVLEFRSELHKAKIDPDLVGAIVEGGHPLSQLLFGSLDFDNLDNVARMAWALGLDVRPSTFEKLAASLGVTSEGDLILDPCEHRTLVMEWAELRRRVYDLLVFDAPTVAAQAVLSGAIETAFSVGELTEDDWHLTDEGLLARLGKLDVTKDAVSVEYWGRLPQLVFWVQIRGSLADLGHQRRRQVIEQIQSTVNDVLRVKNTLAYVFVDEGAFSKRVEFRSPVDGSSWGVGKRSSSTVLYAFSRTRRKWPFRAKRAALDQVLSDLSVPPEICRSNLGVKEGDLEDQWALDFAP